MRSEEEIRVEIKNKITDRIKKIQKRMQQCLEISDHRGWVTCGLSISELKWVLVILEEENDGREEN